VPRRNINPRLNNPQSDIGWPVRRARIAMLRREKAYAGQAADECAACELRSGVRLLKLVPDNGIPSQLIPPSGREPEEDLKNAAPFSPAGVLWCVAVIIL
jgi:hypothetical protein